MIERNISLASTGSARTSGCDNQLRLGYSRNRGMTPVAVGLAEKTGRQQQHCSRPASGRE